MRRKATKGQQQQVAVAINDGNRRWQQTMATNDNSNNNPTRQMRRMRCQGKKSAVLAALVTTPLPGPSITALTDNKSQSKIIENFDYLFFN